LPEENAELFNQSGLIRLNIGKKSKLDKYKKDF